jgi:hypothetical protein
MPALRRFRGSEVRRDAFTCTQTVPACSGDGDNSRDKAGRLTYCRQAVPACSEMPELKRSGKLCFCWALDEAIDAFRDGKRPFPDGTIIAGLRGVASRRPKAARPLAIPNLAWPGHPRTGFSPWSKNSKKYAIYDLGSRLSLELESFFSIWICSSLRLPVIGPYLLAHARRKIVSLISFAISLASSLSPSLSAF